MQKIVKIAIVDYEIGNTCSVKNAFMRIEGCEIILTDSEELILSADAVVLPGVAAYRDAIKSLHEKSLIPILEKAAFELKKPFLGVCLGMQLLLESSEEGGHHKGLGWIPGNVVKFSMPNLHIPHFGWNNIALNLENPLFSELSTEANFYFAHSYFVQCPNEFVLGYCDYGVKFAAIIKNKNIYGMQFHPEKSHTNGHKLLRNFVELVRHGHA